MKSEIHIAGAAQHDQACARCGTPLPKVVGMTFDEGEFVEILNWDGRPHTNVVESSRNRLCDLYAVDERGEMTLLERRSTVASPVPDAGDVVDWAAIIVRAETDARVLVGAFRAALDTLDPLQRPAATRAFVGELRSGMASGGRVS